ncbi:hypothetical protein RintRC_1751 [Richelia intracellularis]|nr:hypothetical protein RintRC_1751 [Richelia intracellularis]
MISVRLVFICEICLGKIYIEPIWELFPKVKVQYPSGFYGYYSHLE